MDEAPRMVAVPGTIREWHGESGWGVVESPTTPGGCWMHFTALDVAGDAHSEITAGRSVEFTYEAVTDQDGFRFRAIRVQVDGLPLGISSVTPAQGSGYRSALSLQYDDTKQADSEDS